MVDEVITFMKLVDEVITKNQPKNQPIEPINQKRNYKKSTKKNYIHEVPTMNCDETSMMVFIVILHIRKQRKNIL